MIVRRFGLLPRFASALLLMLAALPAFAQGTGARLALVLGEGRYAIGALATPANDAGVIAQSLAAAGFDVTGYADVDGKTARRAMSAFVDKARAAGPEAIVFVYLAGYGVQFDGDNFLVPIDATLARDVDVPVEAVRLSDLTRDLAAAPLKARIIVYDLARAHPFAQSGTPLASGLALVEPAAGSLMAFNTAPGAVAAPDNGLYGLYAQALSEMIQVKGLPIETVFARARVRVDALTNGASVPWAVGTFEEPLALYPPAVATATAPKPIAILSADAGYWAAVQRDTLQGYVDFLKAFPDDLLAPHIRAFAAARREALTFAQASQLNTAAAFWTYMRRYPRGPHFPDARRRLAALPARVEPPPRFDAVTFPDLPPPKPDELEVVDKPFVLFDDDDYTPIQAPPSSVVPERRTAFYDRMPPLLAVADGTLPLPLAIPLGFAFERGRIVQPEAGGRAGAIIAIDGVDKAGRPMLTQTGPGDQVLSVASMAVAGDGTRIVTQTGPDRQPVSTITELRSPNGNRSVTQTGPGKQTITTVMTVVQPNGNRLITVAGPDAGPVSVVTTTPNGVVLKRAGVLESRFTGAAPLPRPFVLAKIAAVLPPAVPKGVEHAPELQAPGAQAVAPNAMTNGAPPPVVVRKDPGTAIGPKDVVAPLVAPAAPVLVPDPIVPLPKPVLSPVIPVPVAPVVAVPVAPLPSFPAMGTASPTSTAPTAVAPTAAPPTVTPQAQPSTAAPSLVGPPATVAPSVVAPSVLAPPVLAPSTAPTTNREPVPPLRKALPEAPASREAPTPPAVSEPVPPRRPKPQATPPAKPSARHTPPPKARSAPVPSPKR